MKKINLFLSVLLLFSLFSCRSWFDAPSENEQKELEYGTVCGSVKDADSIKNMRSAFPVVPSQIVYTIIAHRIDEVADDITGSVDVESLSYVIQLTTGTWDIDLKGYNCATLSDISPTNLVFLGDKKNIIISQDNPYRDDCDIIVNIRMEAGLTGTVALPIYVHKNIITSAKVKWQDLSGNQKTQNLTFAYDSTTGLYKSIFTMTDDTDGISAIEPGSYSVSFEFNEVEAGVTTLAYYCQDTVNVYSNMETNSWIDSANDSEYLTVVGTRKQLYLSENVLGKFKSNSVFVKNDGNDSNIGNYFQPFKTIQHAVDVIKERNDGGSQYCVYLLSDIEDSAASPSYTSGNKYSFVNVTTAAETYLKLLIGSFGTTQYTVNLNRSSTKNGGFLYCNGGNTSSVKYQKITVRNLKITGGCNVVTGYGSGITVNSSTVNLVSCDISSSENAGLYVYQSSSNASTYSEVNISGDTKINNNNVGIYSYNGKVNIAGTCDISNNNMYGLETYQNSSNTAKINISGDVNIGNNTVGIYIYGGDVSLTGKCDINNNTEKGVYIDAYSSQTAYKSTCVLEGEVLVRDNKIGVYVNSGTLNLYNKVNVQNNTDSGIYRVDAGTTVNVRDEIIIKNNGTLDKPKNYVITGENSSVYISGDISRSDIGVYIDYSMLPVVTAPYITVASGNSLNHKKNYYRDVFSSDQSFTLGNGGLNDYTVLIYYQQGKIETNTFDNIKLIANSSVINKAITGEGILKITSLIDNKNVSLKSIEAKTYRNGVSVDLNASSNNSNYIILDFSYKTLGNYDVAVTAIYEITDEAGAVQSKIYTANFPVEVKHYNPHKGDVIVNNFIGNNYELQKTSLVCVIEPNTIATIVGSDNNWNSYYSGTDQAVKGAFINGRTVKLSPYAIGQYEVTRELYMDVMANETNGYKGTSSTAGLATGEKNLLRAIDGLNWYDAVYFCNVLTERTIGETQCVYKITNIKRGTDGHITEATVSADLNKTGYRLPTEAEWEFAARGGNSSVDEWKYGFPGINTTKIYSGSFSSDANLNDYGWYQYSTSAYNHEVGKKRPNNNTLSIYDMAGNVSEYCWDSWPTKNENNTTVFLPVTEYDDLFKNAGGEVLNPAYSNNTAYCVLRGGNIGTSSSNPHPEYCLVSYRRSTTKGATSNNRVGMRLCRTLK